MRKTALIALTLVGGAVLTGCGGNSEHPLGAGWEEPMEPIEEPKPVEPKPKKKPVCSDPDSSFSQYLADKGACRMPRSKPEPLFGPNGTIDEWLAENGHAPGTASGEAAAPSETYCIDVTSYDHNWDNDWLCTNPDGSQFYTSEADVMGW